MATLLQGTTIDGYSAIHAGNIGSQSVNYATSAGTLYREDNRTISPSELTEGYAKFGFTSWANNNSAPYADFLHLRSYTDSSGGSDNLIMFKKSGIGMRIWQQTYGSSTAYSSYVDVWTSADFSSTNVSNWNTAYGWGDHSTSDYATTTYVNTQISNLISGAPGALDTLDELAAALGDDANFASTVTNSIATKLPLAGGTMTGRIYAPSFGSDAYGGAFEIRERGFVGSAQSDWSYSPAISFHWGNRYIKRFGLRADGLFAIDDAPIALRSWVTSQGYLTSYAETDTLQSVTSRGSTTTTGASFGGDVGIGSTAPAAKLNVASTGANAYSSTITKGTNMKGIINVLSSNADDMVGVYFGTGVTSEGTHWSGITGSRSQNSVDWSTQLNFYTHDENVSNLNDATQKMVIKGSGDVGIGTTSPGYMLDVAGDMNVGPNTGMNNNRLNFNQGSNYIESGVFFGSSYMTIKGGMAQILLSSAGNVGIGTTFAQYRLDVNGDINFTGTLYQNGTPFSGGGGSAVTSLNLLDGDLTLVAGSGIAITDNGNTNITISATGGGGGGGGGGGASVWTTSQAGGFHHSFSANSATIYWIPTSNNNEVITSALYNNWVAPYSGRIKKIVMRYAAGAVPGATSVTFRKAINGATSSTVYPATITSPSTVDMIVQRDFLSTDITFNAGDRIQVGFTTDGGNRLIQQMAYTVVLEYDII